ncbi:protein kinase domain-containing protein [Streptomyces ovatisporus]|uniref:serine/threonine protein kinase n=1 Tax=Streptomyces ovatisporus TaxID=1128682 RepID=UPI003AA99572
MPSPPEAAGGSDDAVGRVLAGRYRVTGRLGRGGMGVVWRATDEVLAREVAVKELRTWTDAASSELGDLRTRMEREARAAARVRHPGVIAVHDVAQHEGRPVIVMELVEGPSLDDVLRERGSLEPREAAAIGLKVMNALDAAHRAGVLHRDVKPGNVLLEGGGERVVLTDFGIATMEDPDDGSGTRLTGSGELVGSLDYLAPERARGEPPREASDVWALGAMLYAAVEGAVPFRRTSTWSTLNAIVVEPLPEPRRAGPLAPVLAELMAKDPGQRADATRATALLKAVAEGAAVPPASETVRLRTASAPGAVPPGPQQAASAPGVPGRPGPSSPPHGGQGPFGEHHAARPQDPYGSGQLQAGVGGTDPERDTVRTATGRSRGRVLVAAAAAAVVLTGAGVTYAVVAGGEDDGVRADGGKRAGASEGAEGDRKGDGRTEGGRGGKKADSLPGTGSSTGTAEGGGRQEDEGAGDAQEGGSGGSAGTSGVPGGGDAGSGGSTGGAALSGGGEPGPAPACKPRGGGRFDCSVWKKATSFNSAHRPVGELNAGINYFFCQKKLAHRETAGRWTNIWWAKTDDDSGNRKVWVSVVYIRGGGNDEPVPGLPVC